MSTSDELRPGVVGCLCLEHDDGTGADALAGGHCREIPYQPIDEAADLAVKPPVVAEEGSRSPCGAADAPGTRSTLGSVNTNCPPAGTGVREPQQELLVHVLAEQEGPLLGAGGAEALRRPALGVQDLARKGPEVLGLASGIGALDPGDALL